MALVTIRLEEKEKSLWVEAADRAGVSLSEWVRARCSEQSSSPPAAMARVRSLEQAEEKEAVMVSPPAPKPPVVKPPSVETVGPPAPWSKSVKPDFKSRK